jgi:hypothetical protein
MFKYVSVIIIVCFLTLILIPLAAHADVIVEPENDFYTQHRDKIIFLNRNFVANGESGSVPIKKEPAANKDKGSLLNGDEAYMSYSCLYDGEFWGYTFSYEGWVKLDQMLVLYDYVSFEEEHFDEFYRYSGDYAKIKETRAVLVWPGPGAGAPVWTVEDLSTENFSVSYAYTDKDGREWGFVTYLYGNRNVWVCLSEPLNRDMPVLNPAPAPVVWVSETEHIDIQQQSGVQGGELSIIAIVIAMVSVLVLGTAVLIRVVW